MVFNNNIYDQIKSGNFDQDHAEIREGKLRKFYFTFRMGTLINRSWIYTKLPLKWSELDSRSIQIDAWSSTG